MLFDVKLLWMWLQRWGGSDVCRDALGEGGDHHTEGMGKHMEAALCGKITGKNSLCEVYVYVNVCVFVWV